MLYAALPLAFALFQTPVVTDSSAPADIVAALDRSSTRRITTHPGGRMVWRIWGSGYPLVLLHGGSGSWMHWLRNIEALARDFMVLVPDQPGFGESDLPAEETVTPDSFAALVQAGVDAMLGDQHFSYAGFSMGAAIAGHAAPLAGTRLDHLVLVGAAGLRLASPPMQPLQSWRRLPTDAEKAAVHRRNLSILMLRDPARIDDLAVHIQARNSVQVRLRKINLSTHSVLAERLAQSRAAISSIWGERDAIADGYLDLRRDLIESIRPGSSFDVIPGAGHWVQYEAAEAFNTLLRERLRPSA